MSRTKAPMGASNQFRDPNIAMPDDDSGQQSAAVGLRRDRSRLHFLLHFAEMMIAMMIGMAIGVGIFVAIVGVTYAQSRHEYPTAALLVMAVSMTIPMVAWMRLRRHTWRNSMEMGAAMMLPAVPFLVLLWCHVTQVALTGPYMAVSVVAMLALMLYRWEVYSAHRAKPRRAGAG